MSIEKKADGTPMVTKTYRLSIENHEFIRRYAFNKNLTNNLAMENILNDFKKRYVAELTENVLVEY